MTVYVEGLVNWQATELPETGMCKLVDPEVTAEPSIDAPFSWTPMARLAGGAGLNPKSTEPL
ncbi:MAG TPA: hypothetical protein VEV39_14505 [Gemmatimonadales bacterium]|nr:hypothetical protein [Gemmatimonadales bacterium]